jgi:hypothetical protein
MTGAGADGNHLLSLGEALMKELVGYCNRCGKPLYCLDGFFNGVKIDSGKSLCFDCNEQEEKEHES